MTRLGQILNGLRGWLTGWRYYFVAAAHCAIVVACVVHRTGTWLTAGLALSWLITMVLLILAPGRGSRVRTVLFVVSAVLAYNTILFSLLALSCASGDCP
ncbi:MAG: hypothetical protein IPP47_19845 [Bryobacterales bacterium]|nr:hypothetical protein [Bryobacterales bacterium]